MATKLLGFLWSQGCHYTVRIGTPDFLHECVTYRPSLTLSDHGTMDGLQMRVLPVEQPCSQQTIRL